MDITEHSLFCCRYVVIREVQVHINLSTTERDMLIGLDAQQSPCCRCKLGKPGRGELGDGSYLRSQLVEETMRMVMTRRSRASGHPATTRAESWRGMNWGEVGKKLGLVDDGEDCEVIRIDFKNRKRAD